MTTGFVIGGIVVVVVVGGFIVVVGGVVDAVGGFIVVVVVGGFIVVVVDGVVVVGVVDVVVGFVVVEELVDELGVVEPVVPGPALNTPSAGYCAPITLSTSVLNQVRAISAYTCRKSVVSTRLPLLSEAATSGIGVRIFPPFMLFPNSQTIDDRP